MLIQSTSFPPGKLGPFLHRPRSPFSSHAMTRIWLQTWHTVRTKLPNLQMSQIQTCPATDSNTEISFVHTHTRVHTHTLHTHLCTQSHVSTRSSAQGNCSAKSLVSNVVDSSLSSLSSISHAGQGCPGGGSGVGGLGQGVWGRGSGAGGRGHFIYLAITAPPQGASP